jgi:hypothetical protein
MVAFAIAVSAAALGSCSQSNCMAECVSSWSLDLDTPIGQPGNYEFDLGLTSCSVDLPAISSSCATIREYSIVGFASNAWTSPKPARQMHMTTKKDGVVVFDGDASLESYDQHTMCGSDCASARFHMAVPAELAPATRPTCDLSKFNGIYTVAESSRSGGCTTVVGERAVRLSNGLWVPTDPTCQSQLTSWSPNTCRAESTTTCSSDSFDVSWSFTLTDLNADGSKITGTAEVSMVGPVKCDAAANLDLTRQ